jgi:hypothetical protein
VILSTTRASELTALVAKYWEDIVRNSIRGIDAITVLQKFRTLLYGVRFSWETTEIPHKSISHHEHLITIYRIFSDAVLERFTDTQNITSRQQLFIRLICLNIAHGRKWLGMKRYKQALLSFVQDNPIKKIPELINLIKDEEERMNLTPELRGKITRWLERTGETLKSDSWNHGSVAANDDIFELPKLNASQWRIL